MERGDAGQVLPGAQEVHPGHEDGLRGHEEGVGGAEEATHKAWCDEQMGETKQKTLELNHDIEGLTAKMDKAKSRSIKLKDEVAGLQSALADLSKSQAELDKVRRAENAAFKEAKADLEQGLKGVR